MKYYSVTALNQKGRKIKRMLALNEGDDISAHLKSISGDVVSVKEVPGFLRFLNRSRHIRPQEVTELLYSLHLVIRSGLPINTVLGDLAKDADNPALRSALEDIASRVESGTPLSKAMTAHPGIFPDMTVNLVRIGEETGKLDSTVNDAADHMRRVSALRAKTRSALIYPSFAFAAMTAAMIFWLVFVMPRVIGAFSSFQIELPASTKAVISISELTQAHLLHTAALLTVSYAAHRLFRRTSGRYRLFTDTLMTKVPVFGGIVKNYNFAFMAEYVRLMISSGIPLYTALAVMEETITNHLYKRSMKNTRELISSGKSFSAALAQQNLYPNIILRMISIGEQTGNLDTQLENIAGYYYEKVDETATNISKMIEPAVISIIGIFMLVVILGLMGPVFSLMTSLPV